MSFKISVIASNYETVYEIQYTTVIAALDLSNEHAHLIQQVFSFSVSLSILAAKRNHSITIIVVAIAAHKNYAFSSYGILFVIQHVFIAILKVGV